MHRQAILLLVVESETRKFRCLSVECLFVESGTYDVICQFCTVKGMVVESEILKAQSCALSNKACLCTLMDSNINDLIKSVDSFSNEEQSVEDENRTFTNSNKETDIPSTIDFQIEPFHQYSSFSYQQSKQKTNNTNPGNHSDMHD